MPILEKISTLRALELGFGAYYGKEMMCSAMGFPKLTCLELRNLSNLKKWRVEKGSMPNLQDLTIYCCRKLEELPQGLIFLNSLRKLILEWSPTLRARVLDSNDKQGPNFYKVAHVPNLVLDRN